MPRILIVCAASALLCVSCVTPQAIPDSRIPHRLAKPATVTIWVRTPSGFVKQTVRVEAGWWVASPATVEGDAP